MINFQPTRTKGKVVQEIENMHEEENGCVHGFNSIQSSPSLFFSFRKADQRMGLCWVRNIEMGEGVWRST